MTGQKINFVTEDEKIVALEVSRYIPLQDADTTKAILRKLEVMNEARSKAMTDMMTDYENDSYVIEALKNYLITV